MFLVTFKVQAEESSSTNIIRYEGHSRENVAEAVAKAHFRDSNKVILVNRDKFPDAISATNISQGEHPVLYTHSNRVSDSTIELLKTMSLDEIYILGGELSINKEVVDQLQQTTNTKVTRLAGRSRYDANVSAVEENFTQKDHVVVASGEVYSDALYGVSYANTIDASVILTNTNKLESSTHKLLKDLGVKKATIIGGNLTVTQSVEKQLDELNITHNRIAGRNRYIGSAEVANQSYNNPENIVIASGEVFSDALVSAPLAQKLNAPILLVQKNRVENIVKDYLINNIESLRNTYIQGGSLTVSERLIEQLFDESSKHDPVITTKQRREIEEVKFDTEYIEDFYLEGGEERVAQKGINGEHEVVYEQVFEDGKLVKEEELSRTVIREPVTKVVEIGVDLSLFDIELFGQEMLKEINKLRENIGVAPLQYDYKLQEGADIRADEIVEVFSHTRPDGSSFYTAVKEIYFYSYRSMGENIAMNYYSGSDTEGKTKEKIMAERFVSQYANSPVHYDNMVNERFESFATGITISNRFNITNIQIFGGS